MPKKVRKQKWLIVHNRFAKKSGEEIFLEKQLALFKKFGIDYHTLILFRSYNFFNKLRFLFSQNFNCLILFRISKVIRKEGITHVNIHNPYPFISHSIVILKYFYREVKFIHTIHNYRNFCGNGLFYNSKEVCFDCMKYSSLSILRNNCKKSHVVNLSFALRLFFDNKLGLKWKYDNYIVLNKFQFELFSKKVDSSKITLAHNFISSSDCNHSSSGTREYDFIFIGRIGDDQKGFDLFEEFAKRNPTRKFIAMGNIDNYNHKPNNIEFTGFASHNDVLKFLSKSKFLFIGSRSYEVFPNTILEAWRSNTVPVAPNYPTLKGIIGEFGLFYDDLEDLNIENIENFKLTKIQFNQALKRYSENSFFNKIIEL